MKDEQREDGGALADGSDGGQSADLGSATLLPGLFDCHSHLALDAGRKGHLEMMSLSEEEHRALALENLLASPDQFLKIVIDPTK